MVKLIKWLVIAVAVLILLLVIGVVVVANVVDPNDYKPTIIDQVKQQTGRNLQIEGDLAWQLWPPIGLSLGKTSLQNPPDFGDADMLRFNKVVIDVQLLPLVSRAVVVDEIRIDGLYFHRLTNAQGQTNLDDLMAADETAESKQTEPQEEPQTKEDGGFALDDIRLGEGIFVTNATIIDENLATNSRQQLELLSFSIGQFAFGEWFDVAFELQAEMAEPNLLADVSWQSQLKVAKAFDLIELQEGQLLVDASGEVLPKPLSLRMDTAVKVDLSAQQLNADPLLVKVNDLELSAPLMVTSLNEAPAVTSVVTLNEFSARGLMEEMGFPLETADTGVLTSVGLSTRIGFDVGNTRLTVEDINLRLDDTLLTGEASVQPGELLLSRFNLAVNQLNLDRYLPPPTDDAAAPEGPAQPAPEQTPEGTGKAPPPDISFLKTLDVAGKATIGDLQASNVNVNNIKVDLLIKNGELQIVPLTADLYGGNLKTSLKLDANPAEPEFAVEQVISKVQVEPLLKALADADILSGSTEFSANIRGRSLDPVIIQQTLNGSGNFQFNDGAVKGINVAQMIREARAALRGEAASAETSNEPKETDFSSLNGSFTITNGLVNNPDLTLFSPLLRIRGAGDVNLPEQNINYQTKVSAVGTLKGQGGKAAQDLGRLTIPLVISGAFQEPKIKLDLQGAIKDKAKERLDEEKEKLEEKAKEKLEEKARDKFGDKLEGLFR